LSSLLDGIKVAAFAWYGVKISVRPIFDVRFQRRKVDKKANLRVYENWKMQYLF